MCENCQEHGIEEQEGQLLELPQMEIFIPLDIENIEDVQYDEKEFSRGVQSLSFDCGRITALVNAGVSPTDAFTYILNEQSIRANYEQQKLINENNVEVSKIQMIKVEGQSI